MRKTWTFALGALVAIGLSALAAPARAQLQDNDISPVCQRTITADVVALDQVYFWNRLGAVEPQGMIYALRRDVEPTSISGEKDLKPGQVKLRSDKRPRPLVLRMNVGDCLRIEFENLLSPSRVNTKQPNTREASIHAVGLDLVSSMLSDGSNVGGTNPNGLVAPGQNTVYTYFAGKEGTHLFYSYGAAIGGEGEGGSISAGLFGAINVEPQGSVWYRSQVTEQEMTWASTIRRTGHPVTNYNATYPAASSYTGLPILKMLDSNNEIVHGDLTAIIAGPNGGFFPDGTYPDVEVYRNRNEPFRELTIIFHDEIGAVQAFPVFESPQMEHTLHSVRDAFAINYGTGGIGAEILANRLGVGPMYDCVTCKYEEFFLSAWTVGDPAMVVDIPANATNGSGNLITGPKATKAYYPDDPSNVYHSYLNDHVKFRNLLAGSDDHHIFHLHAHQWLHTPNSDNSTYLDSQAIGQGAGFTYEIAYDGSGNRNKTPGDSIFHCHFYPHFAQGMWAMWRVHDVYERGTPLDANGRPVQGSRAYPDAEILAGTPIPGIVPLPGKPMAPLPGAQASIVNGQVQVAGNGNPGFPFYVPGIAGQRPPAPPLDTIHDGGLPRHIVTAGTTTEVHTRLDFTKTVHTATAYEIPEAGTPIEQVAMAAHEQREHATCLPNGTCDSPFSPVKFLYNGAQRQQGAPFADPCIDDFGNPVGAPRNYKAANIELPVIFNKEGWHFEQQRILSLWDDVNDFLGGTRAPEPFFIRANTNDCVEFWHTNLVPAYYEQDDFEVRTPTDILGQHIHLVKFDVLASDGGANGWNYEDGTLAPEEVVHTIDAINLGGGLIPYGGGAGQILTPEVHPTLGSGPNGDWLGAQTTVQRWYVDDVLNLQGKDRTLRTVFTHDHFGPSTHQQVGLYAGLVVEKEHSVWRHPDTGEIFGSRYDGGPTSWRADIIEQTNPGCVGSASVWSSSLDNCATTSYREFLLEFGDFQSAYWDNGQPVNEPKCPNHLSPPCPEAVSAADPGTMVVNYRNEPLALRVWDPFTTSQASGAAGDLAFAYSSQINRALPSLNSQPGFYPPLTQGVLPRDPYTPLLPVYEDDPVQIRVLVGAHEEEHNFTVHGTKWLFEPSDRNSGFRSSQMMGISEHHEFVIPRLPDNTTQRVTDYLYAPSASVDGQWNGVWGILRAYGNALDSEGLRELPTNRLSEQPTQDSRSPFRGICPIGAPLETYSVVAVSASQALPNGTLTYNSRSGFGGPLHDPTAILFVRQSDLDANDRLVPGAPIEPLILRANAGDCIEVTLRNALTTPIADMPGASKLPEIVPNFNANHIEPSENVGLHTQLVYQDVGVSNGVNVGLNATQSVSPGNTHTYQWYAGEIYFDKTGTEFKYQPLELGAVPISSADPIKHTNKGAVGALIIEPRYATWTTDTGTYASATVENEQTGETFREFVLVYQNDVNLRYKEETEYVQNLHVSENAAESGQNAFNYKTEPVWFRLGFPPQQDPQLTIDRFDLDTAFDNATVGGDPETPIFTAKVGDDVRFRVVHPGGHAQNHTFSVHGHNWQELPFTNNSTKLGDNPLSEVFGHRDGMGPTGYSNLLFENGAGGKFGIAGDYMYRDLVPWYFASGLWGILRVEP